MELYGVKEYIKDTFGLVLDNPTIEEVDGNIIIVRDNGKEYVFKRDEN